MYTIDEIIKHYDDEMSNAIERAKGSNNKAFGGFIRSLRGTLLEDITRELVKIAWVDVLKQDLTRLVIDSVKEPIKMNLDYINSIEDEETRQYLQDHIAEQYYNFSTDVQAKIGGKMALAIECKSYTENAMLKRIIFDANLMKELHPEIKRYFLIQVQSQLTGDYSQLPDHPHGSPTTNTLLSRSKVPIEIITLMKGERKVNAPIYEEEEENRNKLSKKQLTKAVNEFAKDLKPYAI